MEEIEFKLDYSNLWDYLKVKWVGYWKLRWTRSPAILTLFLFFVLLTLRDDYPQYRSQISIIFVIVLILWLFSFTRLFLAGMFDYKICKKYNMGNTYHINSVGYSIKNDWVLFQIKWSYCKGIRETRKYFFLETKSYVNFIITKKYISGITVDSLRKALNSAPAKNKCLHLGK